MILTLMKLYFWDVRDARDVKQERTGQKLNNVSILIKNYQPLEKFELLTSYNPVKNTAKCHILPTYNYLKMLDFAI